MVDFLLVLIIELFASSHGCAISRYWSELWFFERVWVTLSANFWGRGRPPMTFGVRKRESLGYHVALFA